jgi:prepilin-type N-terminal cleavage/methylation domain-containing protein
MMRRDRSSSRRGERGFTMIEVLISIVVLTIGLVSLLAMFTVAIAAVNNSQEDMIAKQEAEEALESIYTARNTAQVTFNSIQNVSNGGIFRDGPQPILDPGPDGVDGTVDDLNANPYCAGPSQCLVLAGKDGVLGTADDQYLPLNNYTRTIAITNVNLPNGAPDLSLRQITVTVTYFSTQFKATQKTYSVGAYVSEYR